MESRRVAVRGIIAKDDQLFCVRLKDYPGKVTNDGKDYWCTPGGGVDVGEPLIPALEREMIEETGIKPIIGNLLYIQQFAHNNKEHLEFFFHIQNHEDYERIDLEATTHGAIEIAEVDFIDPTQNTVLPSFLQHVNVAADVQSGITQVFNNLQE